MPNKRLQRPTLLDVHLPNDFRFLRHGHCLEVNPHGFRDLVQLRRVVPDAHRGVVCGRREDMEGSSGRKFVIQSGGRPARLSYTNRLVARPSDCTIMDSRCQKARRSCHFIPAKSDSMNSSVSKCKQRKKRQAARFRFERLLQLHGTPASPTPAAPHLPAWDLF